jgi:hypothetical protein
MSGIIFIVVPHKMFHLASLVSHRKQFKVTNTQAYFDCAVLVKKKIIPLKPGGNVLKLFLRNL